MLSWLLHVLAGSSAFLALFTWSRRTTCAKDHRLFLNLNYPQINEVGKSDHVEPMANIEDSPQSSGNETVKAQKEVIHTLPLSESLRKVIKDKSRLLFIKLQENTYKIKTCTPSPPIRPTYTLQNWGAQPLPIASDARQLFENLFFFHPKSPRAPEATSGDLHYLRWSTANET